MGSSFEMYDLWSKFQQKKSASKILKDLEKVEVKIGMCLYTRCLASSLGFNFKIIC